MSKRNDLRVQITKPKLEYRIDTLANKMSDFVLNLATLGAISTTKRLATRYLKSKEDDFEDLAGLTKNNKDEKYAICFGYAVNTHAQKEYNKNKVYATQRDARVDNVIAPILLNDEILRQHIQIIGTTGSGKTQLLKGVLEQQIARGGGAFAVFGKADNVMLQQIYAVAVEYGREQDFFVVDWTATKEQAKDSIKLNNKSILTNSINLFDLGSIDDVINAMIKIAGLDGESNSWSNASKDYLSSVLRLLAVLRDANLMFNVDKLDEILKADKPLELMKKYKEELSFYSLSEIITSTEKTFKLLTLMEKIYLTSKYEFEILINDIKSDDLEYAKSTNRDKIHLALFNTLQQQIVAIDTRNIIAHIFEDVDNGFRKIPKTEKMFYKLEVSQSHLGNLLTFYNKFGLVLKNRKSDFSFVEAFRSGKIIIFNVPGQESEDAKIIGKMVMAVLNLLVKKQGKAPKLEHTFLGIFDEINSWAKGEKENVFGLGDILSVVRGLGIAGIVAHQSSLDSMGKKTSEKEQLQANINTKIVLKTESSDIIKELNDLVGKKEIKYKRDKVKTKNLKSDTDTDVVERDFFTKENLGSLWAGQGYIIRNRVIEKMITYYLPNKRYSHLDEETIDITKTIDYDSLIKEIENRL
jgi:hypothetical protein